MRRPTPLDLAIVAALVLWGVLEAVLLDGPGSAVERLGWALATTVPLLWRRSAPIAVAGVLAAAVLARMAVAAGSTPEEGAMPFPAILVAAFSVAVHARSLRWAAAGIGALYVATAVVFLSTYFAGGDPQPSDWVVLTFFVVAAAGAGVFVRRRTAGGEQQARQAVVDERARISRELHDIIGHSVSAIALQAGAAQTLLRTDPDKAEEHLGAVQRTAREALVEMRRLMGVLREDEADYAPAPGLGSLGTLVDRAREAGMDVDVVEEGRRGTVAPGVDLAAFRIVQEALTNARKHAGPVRASVRVAYAADAIDLVVANEAAGGGAPGTGDQGGAGLAGAAERARLFGGTLDAAPQPGGGFRVHARLPLGESA